MGVAADGVENNIYLGHCGLEARQLCIDHDVRAERPHELDISRQRRGNDLGRLAFRQLHGEGADVAGRPMDQHPTGAVKTPMIEHHLPGRAAHDWHRGCRGKRQALRFWGEHRGGRHRVLRIRSREPVIRHAEDRVTGPKRNPRSGLLDDAGEVGARNQGELLRHEATSLAHPRVPWADTRGCQPHEYFTGSWYWLGDILVDQRLHPTERPHGYRLHRTLRSRPADIRDMMAAWRLRGLVRNCGSCLNWGKLSVDRHLAV